MVNKAEIGHFDGELKVIAFNEGDTIQTLLTKANLSVGEGEGINNDGGESITVNTPAEDGETYYIVGNFKQAGGSEDLKTFDENALSDAIGDVDEERAEIQKEKAKEILRGILNRKDVVEFNLNELKEELKAIEKELAVFKK